MLRLAVTGSRKFTSAGKELIRSWIFEAVDSFRAEHKEAAFINWTTLEHVTLIHGVARGFDSIADEIARECGMKVVGIPAPWEELGPRAGTSRNWQIIVEGKPNYGLVGPGHYGTGHMESAMKASGIPYLYKGDQPIL